MMRPQIYKLILVQVRGSGQVKTCHIPEIVGFSPHVMYARITSVQELLWASKGIVFVSEARPSQWRDGHSFVTHFSVHHNVHQHVTARRVMSDECMGLLFMLLLPLMMPSLYRSCVHVTYGK